jgi:hypothetical protein
MRERRWADAFRGSHFAQVKNLSPIMPGEDKSQNDRRGLRGKFFILIYTESKQIIYGVLCELSRDDFVRRTRLRGRQPEKFNVLGIID